MNIAPTDSALLRFPASTLPNTGRLKLLIFSQEKVLRSAYRDAAASLGFESNSADNPDQALYLMNSQKVDVVLLDLKPPINSIALLKQIKTSHPSTEILVASTNANAESAVEAIKAGASDYLTKPFSIERLRLALKAVATRLKRKTQDRIRCEQLSTAQGFGGILGQTREMRDLYRLISKAAHSPHPVLILGESGTGKEMVARTIHQSGPYRDKPFIPVDCGSLVPTLIESELFGYVKGAFTGASHSKDGLLTVAEGGTIFLDEVGELSLDLQAKLLRVLQEREVRPVGSTKTVSINVRVLAATNRDLEEAVSRGSFRLDLFYRLDVLNMRVPPLRARRPDIPLLAAKFLDLCSQQSGCRYEISEQAMQMLMAHDWPGNIRELENCIERCCAMSSGPIIHSADLPNIISRSCAPPESTAPHARIVSLGELEKHAILGTIDQLKGDKILAAKLLGIGKTTLYRKLKQYTACAV